MSADSTNAGRKWASGNFSVTPAQVAADFDAEAAEYDRNLTNWGYRVPADGVAMLASLMPPQASVLEAGCGTGMIGRAIHDHGYHDITGCDISRGMLDVARSKKIYQRLDVADLTQPLPYDDHSFTAVVCLATLSFIEDAEPTFREFCRVAEPGGIVLFSQRTDFFEERNCAELCQRLQQEGLWKAQDVSTENPYLPDHPDYADKLTVGYFAFRV